MSSDNSKHVFIQLSLNNAIGFILYGIFKSVFFPFLNSGGKT